MGKATAAENDEEVREVDAAEKLPDRRHQNVLHQRVDDLAEGSADDHADGEVDDGPSLRIAELFQHGFSCVTGHDVLRVDR
jgi:hypothetical protein